MKRGLSQRQDRILQFINKFVNEHQYPPTIRDIQYGCGVSSTSVVDYNLHILQREGYLRRDREVSRGIGLLREGTNDIRSETVSVPLIGNIAAGDPLHIPPSDSWVDSNLENIDVPAFLTKGKRDLFALKVKGDSMIDAFVADGDVVIMHPIGHPENGDMVAAWLEDSSEVTLKRFYLTGDMVSLVPENANMKPIKVKASNVSVRGRVVGVVRAL